MLNHSFPAPSKAPLAPGARAALACAALLLAALGAGAGCAHAGPPPATTHATTAPGAQPRVATEEDYARVRADYDLLAPGDAARAQARQGLEGYQIAEMRSELGADRSEEAWEAISRALGLWDADELKAGAHDEALAAAADELERSFRRRGAHREVLTLLAVQIALRSDDATLVARFDQVAEWLRGEGNREHCNDASCERLLEDLEAAAALWPSPFVVDRLATLYWQRQRGASEASSEGILGKMLRGTGARTGLDLTRLYLRVSRPDEALAALRKLSGQPGDDPQLRDALERYLSPAARPMEAVTIAATTLAREPAAQGVGDRLCADAARRFPDAVEPQLCIAELARRRDRLTVAIRAYETVIRLAPDKRDTWENLARLRQQRLAQLVGEERSDALEGELKEVEAFHARAALRFPAEPLKTSISGAYFEVGRGLYNAGRIDDAVVYLRKSIAIEPSPAAYDQLAVLETKRGRGPEAESVIKEAVEFVKKRDGDRQNQAYWFGKLFKSMGEAAEQMGDAHGAEDARHKSLAGFDQVLSQRMEPDDLAEVQLERGRLFFLIGDRARAIETFDLALQAQPDRGASYADLLSFLVPRGERGEALTTFHRALGRSAVSEYLKAYCSLWILDLDRRTGEEGDPQARQFLDGLRGVKWYHQLARWAIGKQGDAELENHADTPAKKCEANFYRAMRLVEEGKAELAKALWQKVVSTQMMAFFEFDMASYYLHHPAAGTVKAAPQAARGN